MVKDSIPETALTVAFPYVSITMVSSQSTGEAISGSDAGVSDLFKFAQQTFQRLTDEFAAYGLFTNPRLELRQGNGFMCYSDLHDSKIYVSVPDLPDASGKRQALFSRELTGCRDEAQLTRFFQLLLPWGIAHELAHHYRREHGLFGASWSQEEQLANQLASAATKYRLSPQDENELRSLLEQAIDKLSREGTTLNAAPDSGDNLGQALNASAEIAAAAARNIEIIGSNFRFEPEELARAHETLPANLAERLARGGSGIIAFDSEYGSDAVKYMLFQLAWIFLDLLSREQNYVDEFVRDGLQLTWPLLPRIERGHSEPEDREIRACFSAHYHAAGASESASRYFYKRYRAHLLHRMSANADSSVERVIGSMLEQWEDRDYETLDRASHFAPALLQDLFPRSITRQVLHPAEVESHLACVTDRRLWLQVMMGKQDPNAARTLERMAILEQAPILRPLPAETLLDLSHLLCRVLIPEGDPIILEGRSNDDVYVLTKGCLSVSKRRNGGDVTLAFISPGEVFGEMAFLTRRPRSATVRAVEDSECIMVKSADLRSIAYRQPSVALQIARVLAERLDATDARSSSKPYRAVWDAI